MSEVLSLVQVGVNSACSLDALEDSVGSRFPWFHVQKADALMNVDEAFHPQRNQYHSTRILAILEREAERKPASRLLGVADFDLFVPGMNYVFGEARLPGRVGVVSTHRLKPQSVNQNQLVHERVTKEAVHEIGHMLGFNHCEKPRCVMHFSENIQDTDHKLAEFCGNCKAMLDELEK